MKWGRFLMVHVCVQGVGGGRGAGFYMESYGHSFNTTNSCPTHVLARGNDGGYAGKWAAESPSAISSSLRSQLEGVYVLRSVKKRKETEELLL